MSYISEREYAVQMNAIKKRNEGKRREIELKKERNKYGFKLKLPSTSKIVLFASLLICLQIIFFCEHIMVELGDTSALYVLIGIPAAMAPIIWAYYGKSKAENTSGGIIYEQAMMNQQDSYVPPMANDQQESDSLLS